MKEIYFSIIIPVYNVESYLRRCMNSMLNQSFTNYEIILIDDGSTDSSERFAMNILILMKRYKPFIKRIKEYHLQEMRDSA